MAKLALFARLEAKPGKEHEVENFLKQALPLAQQEAGTTSWFAIRMGPATFGIFDTFDEEQGRQVHLYGPIATALKEKSSELLAQAPTIEKVDILAAKLPGSRGSERAA